MSTLNILDNENDVEKVDFKAGNSFEYDFVVPLKPKKTYKVRAKIKTVEKYNPRIFFD